MTWTDITMLAGRLILGGYFLNSAYAHVRHRKMMAGYAASKGVPAPMAAVLGTALLLAAGALSLITGLYPLAGIGLLALFLVGVTPTMHAYWTVGDPMARMGERVNFLKNVALLGALLALTGVDRPWHLTL